MMSPMSATSATFAHHPNHKRTTSHPPPYQSYSASLGSDEVSPQADVSPQNPYLSNSALSSPSAAPPGYAMLPAFDKPRRYSERLHKLMKVRNQPLFIDLSGDEQAQQPYQIVYLDEKTGYADDNDTAYLLPGMPIDEEKQDYYSNSRRSRNRRMTSPQNEFEMSWVAFSALAAALFITVCACSMFVAWTAGFFGDPRATFAGNANTIEISTDNWNDNYRMIMSEGYLLNEDIREDISAEERQAITQLDLPPRWASIKGKANRRKDAQAKGRGKRSALEEVTEAIMI